MMFFAMMLVILYRKVVLIYLIPGHSHNQADRVVAWCRNVMRSKNFYTPMDIVNIAIEIKSIDHCDSHRPFYIGWDTILPKIFKNLPSHYAFNCLFEFDEGHLSIKHLSSTPDTDVAHIQLIKKENFEISRISILRYIFGSRVDTIEEVVNKSHRIHLPTIDVFVLSSKKLALLLKKYFSTPPQYLAFYPAVPIGFTEHSDLVLLSPTRLKRRHVEAIVMMVTGDLVVGPLKAKGGRPEST